MDTPRIRLAQLPTPLELAPRLSQAWGGPTVWVKRDDLTGFGVSGNKVRKLEFHLATAREAGATTLVTCGAVQSNHCRATAIAGAREGFEVLVFLRTPDGQPPAQPTGNYLLQRLGGAETRFVTPDQYRNRDEIMAEAADGIDRPWVIPEGASDALGAKGFELAAQEASEQWSNLAGGPITWWHAASSGGTTAGMGLAVDRLGMDVTVVGTSVGDPLDELANRIEDIWEEGGEMPDQPRIELTDRYIGGGYGLTTDEELAVQVEATRLTGLIFDPTYTGKAIFGLKKEIERGRFGPDDQVIFWHTGGGFAAFAHDFGSAL